MRSALKYFLASFLLLFLFGFISKPTFADYIPTNTNPDVPRNLNTYSQNVLLNVLSSFSCLLTGNNPMDAQNRCLGIDPVTKKVGFVPSNGGALAGMGDLIGMTFNLPIHTADYTHYLASNFGLVKNAYAQSPGYTSLQPLIKVWVVFRDFAYILFVLIFVVIGLAIMLRIKIDPRTVMTIQNQIPKIIIALVLVTLSFAIAGLLIDLMWLIIYLIFSIFAKADPNLDLLKMTNNLAKDPFTFLNDGIQFGIVEIWSIAVNIGQIIGDLVKGMIGAILGGIIGAIVGKIFQGLAVVVAGLILPIVIFFVLFRLWFMLLQSFIMILINVVLAPLWILVGILPTKSGGFGSWIKSMLANIAVFPAVVLMFIIGTVFMDLLAGSSDSTAYIVPLMGDVGIGSMKGLIALGVILLTPNIANMVKAAFKSPDLKLGSVFKPVISAARVPSQAAKQTWATHQARKQPYTTGEISASGMPEYKKNNLWRAGLGTFLGGR